MLFPVLAPEGAPAEVREFSYAGATLVAESFGVATATGAGARPFVLLHGIGMGRSVFRDLVPLLPGRVIGIDLPGFGEAPEPERTLTMARHADLVAAFLRDAGVSGVVVIGHSMGSQIAVELAARHPGLVDGVVLAAPTVDAGARSLVRQLSRLLLDLLSEGPRVLLRGGREYLRGGPHLARKIRATLAHHPEEALGSIRCPVLVLRGERDPVSPVSWCRDTVTAIPDARLAEVPGQGHGTLIGDAGPAAKFIVPFAAGV